MRLWLSSAARCCLIVYVHNTCGKKASENACETVLKKANSELKGIVFELERIWS
jgi:Ni,Fe-hydrogenase III large subunit